MAAHLLFKLGQFRENGEFIDVRLKVDKSIFPAHRNVLAANSDYFHAMFTNGMRESNQEVIELKDENISALGFKVVIDSIYSGELLVNKRNVFDVLTTANHLQMPIIVRQCCDFLDKEYIQGYIDMQTYLHLLAFADLHGLKTLKEATQSKMASVYKEVCESEEFLSHIDASQLLNLLSRDDLNAPSETFVFKSVMQWIKHKKKERMLVAAKVIGAVRLGLVDTKDVVEELNTEQMKRVPEIQMLMCEKLLHSNMPSPNSKFAVEKTRPRSMIPVLVAIFPGQSTPQKGEDSVATEMQYFDAETKSWKPFLSMARLVHATKCICAEVVGNYLYVAVTEERSDIMYRYHTVRNVWERLPRFQSNYFYVGCMSSVNEYIYVFSNYSLIQRYSLAQNDWQYGSDLPFLNKTDNDQGKLVHYDVTAVRMRSKIYVLQGCYKEEKTNHRETKDRGSRKADPKPAVVHCFDPLKNVWKKKASTIHPHFNSSLFVDNKKLYVAGGWVTVRYEDSFGFVRASRGRPAPVEVYNEETDSWYVVEQNRIPPNTLGAVELLGGKVYFIINKFPIDSGIRIPPNEVYKISLREWENSLEKIDSTAALCYLSIRKRC